MKPLGVILAGGRALRMGGEDKGLLPYYGRPLIEHIVEIFRPQVDELLIVANRNISQYSKFSLNVIQDTGIHFQGPLFGILSAMHWTVTNIEYVSPARTT